MHAYKFIVTYIFLYPMLITFPAGKSSDSQNALEDLSQYEILAQLRKASTSASFLDHLNHNGTAAVYRPSRGHDDLPPAIWSPGAQHCSPEGPGRPKCHSCNHTQQEPNQLLIYANFFLSRLPVTTTLTANRSDNIYQIIYANVILRNEKAK